MNNAAAAARKYFGPSNIKSIQFVSPAYIRRYKIVVFVPLKNADELAFKMAASGAGNIGKYSHCSFRTKGVGTFLGSATSNPKVGKKGRFEMTEEIRLEMICSEPELDAVIDTIYKTHPYEEPACEIYPVIVKDTKLNKETVLVKFKKPVKVKNVIGKINPKLQDVMIPAKTMNKNVSQAFIDLTGKTDYNITPSKAKTIVIRKYNNIINIEVI